MNRSLLRHPVIIGGVVVGLLAVTVLNLRTFLPGGAGHQRANSALGYLVPPADLADVVRDAQAGETAHSGLATAGTGDIPGLARDPFSGGTVRPETPRPRRASATPRPARKPDPLVCTAVMLGGLQPLALIGGQAYRPGEEVRGNEVLTIDTDGVRLRRPDGKELLLAVGSARPDSATFHVVTRTRTDAGSGETRLAADPVERNKR